MPVGKPGKEGFPLGRSELNKDIGNTYRKVPCVIGIDQSYTRTGIAISINGKCVKAVSTNFKKNKQFNKTQKRLEVQRLLNKAIDACMKNFPSDQIVVIVERIRTMTGGGDLRPNVIKAHSALVGIIVDTAYVRGIRTYSVDTRCWKHEILGTSRPVFEPLPGVENPQKFGSVRKAIELGFDEQMKVFSSRKGFTYNDDMADAICISLYGFSKVMKVKLEE